MTADASLIVGLNGLSHDSLELAGGKGANLGELIRGGFPVPDGFVVTTAAYAAAVAGSGLPELVAGGDHDGVRAWFDDMPLEPELVAAVTDAYAALGEGPVAVRSSATTEDLAGASFAGQQETVLNVRGADAVLRAVRRCWASLWGDRAVAYRAEHAADPDPQIAVVVQRLVPAEVAGVMFTANPGNGRRDQLVITAAWGLGEAVVAGQVEPDEFVVGAAGTLLERRIADKAMHTAVTADGVALTASDAVRARQPSLRDEQVAELAALGRAVERHFGAPQDIEWTLADGRFQLVQSRPVTALPEPVGDPPTEWPLPRRGSMYFRASIVEQLPDPLTPLFADLIRSAVPAGLNALRELLSPRTRPFDVDFPTINGYAYYDYSRAALNTMWSITPSALRLLFSRDFVFEQWHDHALPAYRRDVEAWQEREPGQLTAAGLLGGVRELLAAGCRYYSNVQMVIPMAASSEVIWSGLYHGLLRGPKGAQSSDFLLGYDSTPIRAEKAMHRLADWCRDVPGLADALSRPGALDETAAPDGVVPAAWAEFRARLDAHLAEFGHTVYNLDFAHPVPADEPGQVVQALRHAITGTSADPEQRQRAAAGRREALTRDLLDRLDPVRRRLAERSLEWAQRWAPHREDALAAVGLAWPVMRRMLHELGRRLTSAGAIDGPDDVYWLTAPEVEEAASALDGGSTTLPGHADDVAARRMRWRGQRRVTPPQYLPKTAWMDAMEDMMPARGEQSGPVLKGTGGSGGVATAPARVLATAADFADFQPGEILVASITTPAYTPLFALAAGVVTDIGGVLSHGSIVAREYGIPAVLGTGTATKRISTGDVITVDGGAGTVRLSGAPDEAANPEVARSSHRWGAVAAAAAAVALIVVAVRRAKAG